MNKKRSTRKKPSLYKIPFKNKIPTQEDDSNIRIEQKRKLSNDAPNKEGKTATITNFKGNKNPKQFKLSRSQIMKERDESYFKDENASSDFSENKVNNEEGNKITTPFKDDEDQVENRFKSDTSYSVINSYEDNSDEINNYYHKITDDVNLLIIGIINNVCEKELKLTTFQQSQFEKDLHKQKNALKKDEDLSNIIKNYSYNSNINDPESENQGMKDLLDNPSNTIKGNEKESRESNDVEDLKNINYNENSECKCHIESTGVKTKEDKDNIKRKNDHTQDEANVSVLNNTKQKKQKIDNKSHAENKCVNRGNDTFPDIIENLENFNKNRNENVPSSELIAVNPYILQNSTSKETQTIRKTHSSKNENKSINLNSLKKDENISLQVNKYHTAEFEENFTNLKSDLTTTPGSWDVPTSFKKNLTIPCMSALDYFNNFKLTETDENSKVSCSSKELPSNTESLHTDKISSSEKELNETEFENSENNAKQANENQTKHPTSHKSITFYKEINKNEDMNSNIPSLTPAETETKYNLDKTEPHNLYSSDVISSISNLKTQTNTDITSCIFSEEEFIAEKIIFREKDKSDENDVIPTGVFKHLNEIFEYNNDTISIDLKNTTPTNLNRFIPEKHDTDTRKCNNCNEDMKTGKELLLSNTKDFTMPMNNNSSKQDDLKFSKTTEVNLNKNEEYIDKNVNLLNSTNAVQENNDYIKVCNNEENIQLSDRHEKLIFEVERKDTVDPTESSTNKARKCPEESCFPQSKTNGEKYFSDFDSCMEMDDDFDLTASQLSMLDADEKMQSTNKINAEQQTDISGSMYIKSDPLTMEIVKELHSLRESIECLKEKLDELSSSKET